MEEEYKMKTLDSIETTVTNIKNKPFISSLTSQYEIGINRENRKILSVVWLGERVHNIMSEFIEQNLQDSQISHKYFITVESCIQYIQQQSSNEKIILVVGWCDGRQIIPLTDNIYQIRSIFIYKTDKDDYQQWTKNYKKVGEDNVVLF